MARQEPLVFRREWAVQINEMLDNDEDSGSVQSEPLSIRREWVVQINEMLYSDQEYAILRVATPLFNMKKEAYIPQFVSIGPYYHSKLEKDIRDSSCAEGKIISTAETRKCKTAASLSQKLRNRGKSFKSIVELMEKMQLQIYGFYHWPASTSSTSTSTAPERDYSQNFALMMAVDSSFMLDFLISYISPHDEASYSLDQDPLQVCIKSDILKLENQIPLTVLHGVFEKAKEAEIYDAAILPQDGLNQLLLKACLKLSPFFFKVEGDDNNLKNDTKLEDIKLLNDDAVKKQQHLLGYMHAFVSPTLQVQVQPENPSLLQHFKYFIRDIPLILFSIFAIPTLFFEQKYEIALNAEKLAEAGIQFKVLSKRTDTIRFDKYSGTVSLPPINVFEMYTEVLLRNMVAWEFNDVSHGTAVMRYVGIMDSLIQTPQDVRVLRDLRIIGTDTLGDDCIAKMWNDLAKPFCTGHLELAPHSGDLGKGLLDVLQLNSKRTRMKRILWGFFEYVSSWRFIAPFAAFLGLAMTAIQTYCTWKQTYPASHVHVPAPA